MSSSKKEKENKFFTLIFVENGEERTTKVPAKKGKTLGDTVADAFDCNAWSTQTHSLFLDNSNTPLSFQSEAFHFGGNSLYVRENEKVQVDKRVASLMRNETPPVSRKVSAVDPTKRFFEVLKNFDDDDDDNTRGLDDVDGVDNRHDNEMDLETCWNDVIHEEEGMESRKRVQQQAIWELFTTEVSFIKDVKVIIDVFQNCFRYLQKAGFLTEVNEALIFANIDEIYDVNVAFWRSLRLVVEEARRTKQTISPCQLVDAFENFEELFQPYIQFCNADTSSMNLPEYTSPTQELLKHYVQWCDSHQQCKRISMSGFLIKPLQRVTKYSLLLKAILNKSDDDKERQTTEEIRTRVETFVSEINSAIHLRQEQEKLNNVVARLSDYCPIEPINDESERLVKEYCNLDLNGSIPGLSPDEKRLILKEGPMKLVEKSSKKEVYVFLFTDVLVITKLKRNIDKYRITRQPYRLNKLLVRELKDPGQLLFIYLNEYGVTSNAFICQVDLDEQEKWKCAINNGKSNYEVIRTEYGLRDNFWDDDLPTSSVSTNKVLRRAACVKRRKDKEMNDPTIATSSDAAIKFEEKVSNEPMKYEWDTTLTLVAAAGFIVINILLARIVRYMGY